MNEKYRFSKIVIGGTFDHLHYGHEVFLKRALTLGKLVVIGLVSEKMVSFKKWNKGIMSFGDRRAELISFLRANNLLERAKIVPIHDIFGPAVFDPSIKAILVTAETLENAKKLNRARQKRGLSPLVVERLSFVKGTDGKRIASTRIRLGEEDRLGRVFTSKILVLGGRIIPEKIRPSLKKPIGNLFIAEKEKNIVRKIVNRYRLKDKPVITVGDVVSSDFLDLGIMPVLVIIDLRIGRMKVFRSLSAFGFPSNYSFCRVINRPGNISRSLFSSIAKAYRKIQKGEKNQVILVSGQEDLATIPAVLLAPLGSYVIYGQPNIGLVVVTVSEKIKQSLLLLLSKFTRK